MDTIQMENLIEWKKKNIKSKSYAHFDRRISLKKIEKYIMNEKYIATHGFYPFITYNILFKKYNKKEGRKIKKREICYSAHIDRYIYSYYGLILNNAYNEIARALNIDDVSIAYRNNSKKNNINFAKEAISYIRELEVAYIIVGDFTNFFGNLNHKYLKEQMCRVLKQKKLSSDFYNIYRNITKYATIQLEEIFREYSYPNNEKSWKKLNLQERVFKPKKLREFKRKHMYINKEKKGIPQGSSISAVLSNIYMIECDVNLKRYVETLNGKYMRYSDDIIIILPKTKDFVEQQKKISEILNLIPELNLHPDKTEKYFYENETILSLEEKGRKYIDYLGFTFDGKYIKIRDKSISKYNYRMRKKCKNIIKCNGITKKKTRVSWENVYKTYSIKGSVINLDKKKKGNYISYVKRAQKIMGTDEKLHLGTSKHLLKIRRWRDKLKK